MAKKDKTPDLPGVEGPGVAPVSIPEVNTAMESYLKAKDLKATADSRFKSISDTLSELMRKHKDEIGVDADGTIIYRHEDEVAILKKKEDLSVKIAPEVT